MVRRTSNFSLTLLDTLLNIEDDEGVQTEVGSLLFSRTIGPQRVKPESTKQLPKIEGRLMIGSRTRR